MLAVNGYRNGSNIILEKDVDLTVGQQILVTIIDSTKLPKKKVDLSGYMRRGKELVSSVVTCEEYLVFAYRGDNKEKEEAFFDFINGCNIPIYNVTTNIAKRAAQIRAKYKYFKGMDALQLATACETGCDLFLTNDKQLKQFKELRVF